MDGNVYMMFYFVLNWPNTAFSFPYWCFANPPSEFAFQPLIYSAAHYSTQTLFTIHFLTDQVKKNQNIGHPITKVSRIFLILIFITFIPLWGTLQYQSCPCCNLSPPTRYWFLLNPVAFYLNYCQYFPLWVVKRFIVAFTANWRYLMQMLHCPI